MISIETCPVCYKGVRVRSDGKLAPHNDNAGKHCPGSRRVPR